MKAEEQQIAIAEACGAIWFCCTDRCGLVELLPKEIRFSNYKECARPKPPVLFGLSYVPEYLHDWNAMHEAVNSLPAEARILFLSHLDQITLRRSKDWFPARMVTSTLGEWSEAFLRTVDKWDDSH